MADPNPLSTLEAALAQLALTPLTNIQTAFNMVAANPGNQTILLEQEAVVIANVNTLIAEAPAAIPILQQTAIGYGAAQGSNIVGQIIAALQNVITPPAA